MTSPPLRDARRSLVRDRVVVAIREVLADGQDPTYAAVARRSGVPERTLYRHFPTRSALMASVVEWVNDQTGRARPTTRDDAIDLTRELFITFDRIAPVMRELLSSPDGLAARLQDNDERRAAAVALVEHETTGLDTLTARRIAAVAQLMTSAAAWQALRDFWQMDGEEAAATVAAALTALLAGASTTTRSPTPEGAMP